MHNYTKSVEKYGRGGGVFPVFIFRITAGITGEIKGAKGKK